MNFHDWILVAVPIIAVVITAGNAWALKLYEIRKAKDTPNNPQDAPAKQSDKAITFRKFLNWFFWPTIIAFNVYQIQHTIQYPRKEANYDALRIALSVSEILGILILLLFMRIITRILPIIEKHLGVTEKLQNKVLNIEQTVVETSKRLDTLSVAPKRKK